MTEVWVSGPQFFNLKNDNYAKFTIKYSKISTFKKEFTKSVIDYLLYSVII